MGFFKRVRINHQQKRTGSRIKGRIEDLKQLADKKVEQELICENLPKDVTIETIGEVANGQFSGDEIAALEEMEAIVNYPRSLNPGLYVDEESGNYAIYKIEHKDDKTEHKDDKTESEDDKTEPEDGKAVNIIMTFGKHYFLTVGIKPTGVKGEMQCSIAASSGKVASEVRAALKRANEERKTANKPNSSEEYRNMFREIMQGETWEIMQGGASGLRLVNDAKTPDNGEGDTAHTEEKEIS